MSKLKFFRIKLPVLLSLFFLASFSASDVRRHEHLFNGTGISDLCDTALLTQNAAYSQNFDFVGYPQNIIEWSSPKDALLIFDKLQHASSKKVTVLHIGDSHVQADIYTGKLRRELQQIFGSGGRGLIFPYAAAGTHSPVNYKTGKTGQWTFAKNIHREPAIALGLTGISVRTNDAKAGFSFKFADGTIQQTDRKLKIFCKKDSASFDLKIFFSENFAPATVRLTPDGKDYAEIVLPEITQNLSFEVQKSSPEQNFLECYGISIESIENKGIIYHAVGINGAGARSILKQNLFEAQLATLKPDLVILDLGTNDLLGKEFYKDDISANYGAVIDKIRSNLPEAALMLANSQEVVYRGKNVPFFADFSAFTRELAAEKQCIFYDYYNISGGRFSMTKWHHFGLAQADKIHLSTSGYVFKGELFFNALLNSYRYVLNNHRTNSLLATELDTNFCAANFFDEKQLSFEVKFPKNNPKNNVEKSEEYIVKRGDNLSVIAQKFSVSVSNLMDWNNLITTKLSVGKKLFVFAPNDNSAKKEVTAAPPMPRDKQKSQIKKSSNNLPVSGIYKVKNGDSLWLIAKKFGTSIEFLRKINHLKSDKLHLGQSLKIKN